MITEVQATLFVAGAILMGLGALGRLWVLAF